MFCIRSAPPNKFTFVPIDAFVIDHFHNIWTSMTNDKRRSKMDEKKIETKNRWCVMDRPQKQNHTKKLCWKWKWSMKRRREKKGKKQSEKYWNAFCLSLHTVSKHIERWIKTKRNETKMHENKLRNEMFSRLAFGMAQCFADCCFRFPLNVLSFLCCPFLLIAAINLNARSSAISPIRTRHIDTHTNDSSRAHTHTTYR